MLLLDPFDLAASEPRAEALVQVLSQDRPITIPFRGRTEQDTVRYLILIQRNVAPKLTRAAETSTGAYGACAWRYETVLQRQTCSYSLTGLFMCTAPELRPLPEQVSGTLEIPSKAELPTVCSLQNPQLAETQRALEARLKASAAQMINEDVRSYWEGLRRRVIGTRQR